ncbi:MAG: DUF4388 domain-containing protein [Kofleriaceae bacterium]
MMLLAGTLAELDLLSLAEVTSLGRSSLRLEVTNPNGDLVGYLILKAGRVVSATAGSHHGRRALPVILGAAANARFRLVRDPLDYVMESAVAMVDELAELRKAAPRMPKGSAAQPIQGRGGVLVAPRPSTSTRPPALAAGTGTRIKMMEGRLDEFDLTVLLQVIGMGRTCVELEVVGQRGQPVGAVWVKAGKVVAARAGDIEGLSAISQLLGSKDGYQFTAFRVDRDLEHESALASVHEILTSKDFASDTEVRPAPRSRPQRTGEVPRQAARPAPAPPPKAARAIDEASLIMEGSLADFDVATILQTVACGRQYCVLELRSDAALIGNIHTKGGAVLSAATSSQVGVAALQALLALQAPHWFRLLRMPSEIPTTTPLGNLHQLLLQVGPVDGPPQRETIKGLPTPPRADVAPPAAPAREAQLVPLMEGTLADFDLRTLLEVVAVTRQHSRVMLFDGSDIAIGEIRLKAGHMLGAQAGIRTGTEALTYLLSLPRVYRFRVFADLRDVSVEWVDTIGNLLAAATVNHASGDRPRSGRALWVAIPVSFLVGGAIVFFLARGGHTTSRPSLTPALTTRPPAAAAEPPGAASHQPTRAPEVREPEVREPEVREPAGIERAQPPRQVGSSAIEMESASPRGMSVQNAQIALKKLGYNPGPIDNKYGRLTREAILHFQRTHGLLQTGFLDRETWGGIVQDLTAP